jgi:glycosyltransferase involved in cell wall biosynthesis
MRISRPRLAVLCDFPEEQWPSMDLCADMLLAQLQQHRAESIEAVRICPSYRRRFTRLPLIGRRKLAGNADRLCNRHWDYPRALRPLVDQYSLFHVIDHSYAHLVHGLPADRTGVFCHDLDAFRCLLEPQRDPRPRWFRALARRALTGMQRAAIVFHTTREIRRQIEQHDLVDSTRLVQAPYGWSTVFDPDPDQPPQRIAGLPGDWLRVPFLLHVGSCVPRKRIDVLLEVFSGVRRHHPLIRLIQVGGTWTEAQRQQIDQLNIAGGVLQLPRLEQQAVAELYRRAAVVLLPSEAEGFGLPVIEALACGAIMVVSDIPVIHEVGGAAALFCPVADVAAWVELLSRLLADPGFAPPESVRLAQAGKFSWETHAQTILEAYQRLLK